MAAVTRVGVLVVDGSQTVYRSHRRAMDAARVLVKHATEVTGTWPRKVADGRVIEVLLIVGDAAQRAWDAYHRQSPCQWCGDVSWRFAVCTAGQMRRVCGTCSHPAYDCYCGRSGCEG